MQGGCVCGGGGTRRAWFYQDDVLTSQPHIPPLQNEMTMTMWEGEGAVHVQHLPPGRRSINGCFSSSRYSNITVLYEPQFRKAFLSS